MASDDYRAKAAEFAAKAQQASDPDARIAYEMAAQGYLRLADQAERNRSPPPFTPRSGNEAQPMQQQEQTQPGVKKPDDE
jgi:hypothetical protein